jgi:hypothetical protein
MSEVAVGRGRGSGVVLAGCVAWRPRRSTGPPFWWRARGPATGTCQLGTLFAATSASMLARTASSTAYSASSIALYAKSMAKSA